jgi:hypothetical protein
MAKRKLPEIVPGVTFGSLTTIERDTDSVLVPKWRCLCVCSAIVSIKDHSLRERRRPTCQCAMSAKLRAAHTTHGLVGTAEHVAWGNMRSRCICSNRNDWALYGGRGITCDPTWASFEAFLRDMGPKPSPQHSLGRIDNDGPYSPSNCRWESPYEQGANKRNNHRIGFRGKELIGPAWAREVGINPNTLKSRLNQMGWTAEDALSKPTRKGRYRGRPGAVTPAARP